MNPGAPVDQTRAEHVGRQNAADVQKISTARAT